MTRVPRDLLAEFREQVEQVERTGTTDGVTMKGLPTVLLTYRGAKTGMVRKTLVMRVEHEGSYAAVASSGGAPTNPKWYAGLVAEPLVDLQDGTVTREYRAREVFGDEKARWWRRAVDAYPDYAEYQRGTDRQIPVFVLEPIGRGLHSQPSWAAISARTSSASGRDRTVPTWP